MPNIKIDLSKFNSKDRIQITPYFIYEDRVNIANIQFEMPSFPSKLSESDLSAIKKESGLVDITFSDSNTYRIVGYSNLSNQFVFYLEGKWYYNRDSSGKIINSVWNKTGVVDENISLQVKEKIIVTASATNSLTSLNGRTFAIKSIGNNPGFRPITNATPSTGSVNVTVSTNITSLAKSTLINSVNPNTAEIREYEKYAQYDLWQLSAPNNYITTLNNNNYIIDVIIFAYSINDLEDKYLVQVKNSATNQYPTTTQIPVSSNIPTYSQIQSFYIRDNSNEQKMSVKPRMYYSLGATTLKFYARTIRYIDPTGQRNFINGQYIDGQPWINLTIGSGPVGR